MFMFSDLSVEMLNGFEYSMVVEQFMNSSGTVLEQFRNGSGTVKQTIQVFGNLKDKLFTESFFV